MARREDSAWRLPWKPVTGDWLKLMWDLMFQGPVGNNPIADFLSLLTLIPFLVVLALWLGEMVVELVLWPFVVAGRAVQRLWVG